MVGDAEGVLKAVVAKKAKCPGINVLIAEIGLVLARTPFDLEAAHIWSEENTTADVLSRRAHGEPLPPELAHAERVKVAPFGERAWSFLGREVVV